MASAVASRDRSPAGRRPLSGESLPAGAPSGFSLGGTVDRFQTMLKAQERSPFTVKQYGHIAKMFLGYDRQAARRGHAQRSRAIPGVPRPAAPLQQELDVHDGARAHLPVPLVSPDVAEGLEAPRRPERLPHYLTEEETHRLFGAVQDSARDSAIVHVLAFGGLRVGELCHLTLDDLDLESNILHVRNGKGDKDREVVMEEKSRAAMTGTSPNGRSPGSEATCSFPSARSPSSGSSDERPRTPGSRAA